MRTDDVLKKLRAEGFEIDGVMIGQAIKAGAVDEPPKRNLQFVYADSHLRQLRKYLRGQSVGLGKSIKDAKLTRR